MCLLVLAWKSHPRYRLILAGNRDEFHDRAAAPLNWWQDDPRILGGRDLKASGTWLGVARSGRFGIVTNYRDLQAPVEGAPSRGNLVPRFLTGATSPKEFLDDLRGAALRYSGFNLLVGGTRALYYFSNRGAKAPTALAPGVYGLSNHLLDTPWPKLARTRSRFAQLLAEPELAADDVFAMLGDREQAPVDNLPSTGLPTDWERVVSAPFIVNERYGTRCSSLLLVERTGRTVLHERRFDAMGVQTGTTRFEFTSAEVPEVWFEAEDPNAAAAVDTSFDSSPE
ncbi:MAG TPA: NRDE family protein [Povalibacter sp.]|uniref:NRDE family protein n=1 Tax=Povalibacter sp. TaxID=1962978 RepID=UPI002C5A16D7|nr:NRDE family protein [Povalibacter sp.]HMN43574.1 NRDE family protein [Povalibacter sp.]